MADERSAAPRLRRGLHHQRRAGPARADADAAPAWLPAAVAEDADQVVLLVLDGLGWDQLAGPPRPRPDAGGAWTARPITTVAPSTTATALTSITTGLPPGEHGVVGYRMAVDGDVLNVLRWTTAGGRRPASDPARQGPGRRRLRRPAPAGRDPGRVPRLRLHPGPPRPAPASPATACRRRWSPRSRQPAARAASRSSTPTTTASTRSPTSTASASTTTPSWRSSTAWSATSSRCCRRVRCSSSPPTTARSTSATDVVPPDPEVLAHVRHPVGRGPVPLAARPPRAEAALLPRRPASTTPTWRGW